jgi:uncharacterized membrane protein (Fun14 family)
MLQVHLCAMNRITSFISFYRKTIVGGVLGMVLGYAYYYFIGCSSGSCAISSNPLNSTLYGALMGVVAVGWPEKKQTTKSSIHE